MAWREQLAIGELTSTNQSKCTFGIGTKEGGGVPAIQNAYKITERGTDVHHKTVFTFNDTPITLLDTGTGEGTLIYTFPEGAILFNGGTGSIAITTTSTLATTLNASSAMSWGVGSVTQQGNITLATTEQDFIPTTAITSSATIDVAGAVSSTAADGVLVALDGTSTAIELHLNFAIGTATDIDADATITVDGTVNIFWTNLGDY